ncbi:MAG: site-specific integrase [Planctomycetaceae bacterium]|jgi:integrase|nr:site-specific integrase [Planctomycetaceae bacterium]
MATIYLSLSTKVELAKRQEILIRFSHGRINQRAKSNIFILSKYWDAKTQQIIIPNSRLMTDEKKELKQYLTTQSGKLDMLIATIQTEFNNADKNNLTAEWLKLVIDRFNFPEKYVVQTETEKTPTFFEFVDAFLKEYPNRTHGITGLHFAPKTIQQYNALKKHLNEFAESNNKTDFEFSEIDKSFYDNFIDFFKEKSFTANSMGKYIKALKSVLNSATEMGYYQYSYGKKFIVTKDDVDTIYLNETELQQLKDADLSKTPYLDRVRDWFLLLSWTGCRFSDLGKLTKTDIKDGFITFRQQKTNNKVVIPLHPVVTEILEKYNYNMPAEISNQKFNEYIKEACKFSEINSIETTTRTVSGKLVTEKFEKWEQVSSHTGRRSFCTNMYKRGLSTLMIMSISGHKTEKSFLKYIKVKQNEHAEMMKKAWENMYK